MKRFRRITSWTVLATAGLLGTAGFAADAKRPLSFVNDIVPILIEGGYGGYIDSEYEGNRWIQDAFVVDSAAQVKQHQAMLKRLLGEA